VKGLPMLNQTEAPELFSFLEAYMYLPKPYIQSGLPSNQVAILSRLIKKGYLVRPKRGEYRLTFVKYAKTK
jgi:hypothetical protein